MYSFRQGFMLRCLIVVDMLAIAGCLALGMFVSASGARHAPFRDFLSVRISLRNALLMAAYLYAARHVLVQFGLYRSRGLAYGQILKAASVATLLLGAMAAAFRIEAFDRKSLAVFGAASAVVMAASRAILYGCWKALRRGNNLRHVVIVGAGVRGLRFAEVLERRPEL